MKLAFTIVYIVVALLLTVIVLFQKGKDPRSAGAVMGNSGDTFFSKNKSNTREGMLEKLTAVFAILFIILSVVLTLDLFK